MPKCDIIIPVWNKLEYTKSCIASIMEKTKYPYRLIIVDNASLPETATFLENLAASGRGEVLLIRNEQNEGFIKAINKGIRACRAPYICILNNDTVVTEGWMEESIKVLTGDASIGIVNPSSNTLGQKLGKNVTPDTWAADSKAQSGNYIELKTAAGFCMFMRKEIFDTVGLLDEAYGMGNFDDMDFSLRAREKGYKIVRALAAYVYHTEKSSFRILRNFGKDFKRNREAFEAKWGRTERIAVVFGEINGATLARLGQIVEKHAMESSWVYVIAPFFDTREFMRKFSGITFYHFRRFFYLRAFLKILFKRKKPRVFYCDNGIFSSALRIFLSPLNPFMKPFRRGAI
ncbi:MAG: glycosyltransferase family 2 protein [Candidatus Omnitrophica bacterium]|nr:glycosyltransferase family 2 protein [Candidatus Omnitrophota bacterium]